MKMKILKFIVVHVILAYLVLLIPSEFWSVAILFIYGFTAVPNYFRTNDVSKIIYAAVLLFAILFGCITMLLDGCPKEHILVYLIVMLLQYPLRGVIQSQRKNNSLRK